VKLIFEVRLSFSEFNEVLDLGHVVHVARLESSGVVYYNAIILSWKSYTSPHLVSFRSNGAVAHSSLTSREIASDMLFQGYKAYL
jgi:hypothetical protein